MERGWGGRLTAIANLLSDPRAYKQVMKRALHRSIFISCWPWCLFIADKSVMPELVAPVSRVA